MIKMYWNHIDGGRTWAVPQAECSARTQYYWTATKAQGHRQRDASGKAEGKA